MSAIPYEVDIQHVGREGIRKFTFMPSTQTIMYNFPKNTNSLLIFSAAWCGYCQELQKNLIALEKKTQGRVPLIMIDVDKASNLVQNFKTAGYPVPHFPTIYVIRAGSGEILKPLYEGDRDPASLLRLVCTAGQQRF